MRLLVGLDVLIRGRKPIFMLHIVMQSVLHVRIFFTIKATKDQLHILELKGLNLTFVRDFRVRKLCDFFFDE